MYETPPPRPQAQHSNPEAPLGLLSVVYVLVTTLADVVDSFPPLSSSSIIVFVILFVLLSPRLRSVINVYNCNGLPNVEVAAQNIY